MSPFRTTVLALTAVAAFGAAMASTTTPASAWQAALEKASSPPRLLPAVLSPVLYAAPVVYSSYRPAPRVVSAPSAAPVAGEQNPSSCLSKAYTPEGQVVFSDNCTRNWRWRRCRMCRSKVRSSRSQQSEAPAPQQQNFAGRAAAGSVTRSRSNSGKAGALRSKTPAAKAGVFCFATILSS